MSPSGRSSGFVSSFYSEGASREVKGWQEDFRGIDALLSATLFSLSLCPSLKFFLLPHYHLSHSNFLFLAAANVSPERKKSGI